MLLKIKGNVVDEAGQPQKQVLVSNGELVVTTDDQGRYEIECELNVHRHIMVSSPDGFRPKDHFFQPVTDADQPLNFTFVRDDKGSNQQFRLAHISDTHLKDDPRQEPTAASLASALETVIQQSSPDFIIHTGDVTHHGSADAIDRYQNVIEPLSTPVFTGYGGHDSYREYADAHWNSTCIHNFETIIGPTYFSFDWGGYHFVVYPNEDFVFSASDIARKRSWLRSDLAMQPAERPIVVATHLPPDRALVAELDRYNVVLVMHGHIHSTRVMRIKSMLVTSIMPLTHGTVDTNPRGYRIIDFDPDGTFKLSFQPIPRATDAHQTTTSITSTAELIEHVWKAQLPAYLHRAQPVLHNDLAIVCLQDLNDVKHHGVCALDAHNGEVNWQIPTESVIGNRIAVNSKGQGVAVSLAGRLYHFDLESGDLLWSFDLPDFPERFIATSPVLTDDRVFLGTQSGCGCWNLETQTEAWYRHFIATLDIQALGPGDRYLAPIIEGIRIAADPIGDGWASRSSPLIYSELLIVFVPRRGLVAMRQSDGTIAWEQPMKGALAHWASPIISNGLLVAAGDPGNVMVVDSDNGQLIWHQSVEDHSQPDQPAVSWHITGLAGHQEAIYAVTAGGDVICLDLKQGDIQWRYQVGLSLYDMVPLDPLQRSILAAPEIADDKLLVGAIDGELHILQRQSGELLWRENVDSPISSSVALSDDGFYVGTWDGHLSKYKWL